MSDLYATVKCVCGHTNLVRAKVGPKAKCQVCHARLYFTDYSEDELQPWAQVTEERAANYNGPGPEVTGWKWHNGGKR